MWGIGMRLSVSFIPTPNFCYYNEKTRQVHKLPMLSADNWGGLAPLSLVTVLCYQFFLFLFCFLLVFISDASANVHMRYLCQSTWLIRILNGWFGVTKLWPPYSNTLISEWCCVNLLVFSVFLFVYFSGGELGNDYDYLLTALRR